MWLQVNNCCKGAVACSVYHEGVITGIMFCHLVRMYQTGVPTTGWAYQKREGKYENLCFSRESSQVPKAIWEIRPGDL